MDGVNNIEKDVFCIGFYSINPPGKFYDSTNDSNDLILNSLINWDSPLGQTIFFDKWYYFRDIHFFSNMHLIVEIHTCRLKKEKIEITKYAWTIV